MCELMQLQPVFLDEFHNIYRMIIIIIVIVIIIIIITTTTTTIIFMVIKWVVQIYKIYHSMNKIVDGSSLPTEKKKKKKKKKNHYIQCMDYLFLSIVSICSNS